jgi:hypothetical protein
LDVADEVQVGFANVLPFTTFETTAMMWRGTAESAVNLHPPKYASSLAGSVAYGTNGIQQVGFASDNPFADTHAYVWSGSAESGVDLQPYLSPLGMLLYRSVAFDISEDGVIVGEALDSGGDTHAVMWTPILVGDFNLDGYVNAADYTVWRDSYGQSGEDLSADGNGDERVDEADYVIWRERFGDSLAVEIGRSGLSTDLVVPEPSNALILSALAALFICRIPRKM